MEGDNRRIITLVVVSVAVAAFYLVSQYWGSDDDGGDTDTPTDPSAQVEGDHNPSGITGWGSDEILSPETEAERAVHLETATIETASFRAEIDNLGGGVKHFWLTGDTRFHGEDGEPEDLVTTTDHEYWRSLRLHLPQIHIPNDAVWDLEQVSPTEVRLRWEGNGIRVTRSLRAGEGPYQIWSTVRVENLTNYARTTRVELSTYHYVARDEESGSIPLVPSRSRAIGAGVCIYDDETERKDRSKLVDEDHRQPAVHGYGDGDVAVAAVENTYFTQALAAHGAQAQRCAISGRDVPEWGDSAVGTVFEARLIHPWTTIEPGGELRNVTLAYFGPKDLNSLNLAGHELPKVLNLGFFAIIANQLARLLNLLHGFIGNWGLAIILLTLLIRLTLFPLTNLSFNSMAKMRQLKPEMDRVNELYKDDAEKKGAAVMELYRKNKINPLSGCLPSLVQLPVWWALFTSLSTNIELYHRPLALWWTDLSAPDPYFVLPLCLGLLMHLQQRLTPTTMDPTQAKMMMYFMPVMITVFMLFYPSGLCLYMLTNSALGIGQMQLNNYRLSKAAPLVTSETDTSEADDDDAPDDTDGADPSKPQKRRPRRKRRLPRGRA